MWHCKVFIVTCITWKSSFIFFVNLFQVNYPLTKRMSLERKGNFAPSRALECSSPPFRHGPNLFADRKMLGEKGEWRFQHILNRLIGIHSSRREDALWAKSYVEHVPKSLSASVALRPFSRPKIAIDFQFQSRAFPLESVWVHVWETLNPCGTHTWLQWL